MSLVKQVSTGSKQGNCYIYNSLMLDIGCSYSKIKEYLNDIKVIFISHAHGDHANIDTMKKIKENHPKILFTGCDNMKDIFEDLELNHKIMKCNIRYDFGIFELSLVKLYHNIDNYGVRVFDDLKGIYITDTAHVEGITAKDYDWYIVESNHDDLKIQEAIKYAKENGLFDRYTGARNSHLSMQQCDKFLRENAKEGSEILKCHLGSGYDPFDYDLHYYYEKEN